MYAMSFDYGQARAGAPARPRTRRPLRVREHRVPASTSQRASALTDPSKSVPKDSLGEAIPATYVRRATCSFPARRCLGRSVEVGDIFIGANALVTQLPRLPAEFLGPSRPANLATKAGGQATFARIRLRSLE